jgi:hypothetical protein
MNELTEAFVQISETMKLAFDAADGLRADLAGRGYSETAQEQIALMFLEGVNRQIWASPKN